MHIIIYYRNRLLPDVQFLGSAQEQHETILHAVPNNPRSVIQIRLTHHCMNKFTHKLYVHYLYHRYYILL